MDPEKLALQRYNVEQIRNELPQFVYGLDEDEDVDDGQTRLEERPPATLSDGANYTGQWSVATR